MTPEPCAPRVIVCGGRDYNDWRMLSDALDALEIGSLAHGAARGADRLAEHWAYLRGVPYYAYPARWDRDGRSAGVRRNQLMLELFKPHLVVAFPGGRGTADMVQRARAANVPVVDFGPALGHPHDSAGATA